MDRPCPRSQSSWGSGVSSCHVPVYYCSAVQDVSTWGIDRLDYMKGIPHKLMAFGCFLEHHPDWADKCVLVQLAVPSRRDVPEYQRLQRQVHELVGDLVGCKKAVIPKLPWLLLQTVSLILLWIIHISFWMYCLILSKSMLPVCYQPPPAHHVYPLALCFFGSTDLSALFGAGQISGKHSSIASGVPVIYMDSSMSPDDLSALYNVADVALITSLRDSCFGKQGRRVCLLETDEKVRWPYNTKVRLLMAAVKADFGWFWVLTYFEYVKAVLMIDGIDNL